MSSAVDTQTPTAPTKPNDITNIKGSGTAPDGNGDAPPETDPGPTKG